MVACSVKLGCFEDFSVENSTHLSDEEKGGSCISVLMELVSHLESINENLDDGCWMRRQLCQGFGVLEVALRGVPQKEGSAEEGTCHHLYIAFLL
jgi:hypothetical protein